MKIPESGCSRQVASVGLATISKATPSPSESHGKLLCQCVRGSIGDLINVALHIHPGPRLRFVLSVLQLLDLLDMMTAVSQQQAVQRILRQVWIGLAQKNGDFFRI